MPGRLIHSIPDTLVSEFYPAESAVVSTWQSFRTGKVQQAIRESVVAGGATGAKTIIIDVSSDPGVLATKDMEFTNTVGARLVRDNGFKALINVVGKDALTKLGARKWASIPQASMATYECATLSDALDIARKIARGEPVTP